MSFVKINEKEAENCNEITFFDDLKEFLNKIELDKLAEASKNTIEI